MRRFLALALVSLATTVAAADETATPAPAAEAPAPAPAAEAPAPAPAPAAAPMSRDESCATALHPGTNPTEALLEACVPAHPMFFGFVGLGGHWQATTGGGAGILVQANSNPIAPLLVSARARVGGGGLVRVEAMGGFILSGDRDIGIDTWNEDAGSDRYYNYYTVHGARVVKRTQVSLEGGLRFFRVNRSTDASTSADSALGVQAGIAYHRFNDLSNYEVIQGHIVHNFAGGSGLTLGWHNSIPVIPHLVFGIEVGYVGNGGTTGVPVDMFGTLDFGWALGR